MGVVARVGEGGKKKDYGFVCWEAGGGGEFSFFYYKAKPKITLSVVQGTTRWVWQHGWKYFH